MSAGGVRAAPIKLSFLSAAELEDLLRRGGESVLAEIHFGEPSRSLADAPHPHVLVQTPQLGEGRLIEVWTSPLPTDYLRHGHIACAFNPEVLFGCVTHAMPDTEAAFETTVQHAYGEILRLLAAQGYPHLLRMWNYFPRIGQVTDGLDRYQYFCRGRGRAFAEYYGEFHPRLSAASAVGTRAGDLVIYFVAARQPGKHLENPRQVSAYHYPPQYGPRSPSFARATLKHWGGEACLYISGTASVVGHASQHIGDPAAQLQETLRNLRALLESTGVRAQDTINCFTHTKIYLRDPQHMALLGASLGDAFLPHTPKCFLQADICRTELLLEIEAVAEV